MANAYFDEICFSITGSGALLRGLAFPLSGDIPFDIKESLRDRSGLKKEVHALGADLLKNKTLLAEEIYKSYNSIILPQIIVVSALKATFDNVETCDAITDKEEARKYTQKLLRYLIETREIPSVVQHLTDYAANAAENPTQKFIAATLLEKIKAPEATSSKNPHGNLLLEAINKSIPPIIEGEIKRYFEDCNLSAITPTASNNYKLENTSDLEKIIDENTRQLGRKFNEFLDTLAKEKRYKAEKFGIDMVKRCNTMLAKAPNALKPLLTLFEENESADVIFYKDLNNARSYSYLPNTTAGGYSWESKIAYLPATNPLEAQDHSERNTRGAFAMLEGTFIKKPFNQAESTLESIWMEELMHGSIDMLYKNKCLPFRQHDNAARDDLKRAFFDDLQRAISIDEANGNDQQLSKLSQYTDVDSHTLKHLSGVGNMSSEAFAYGIGSKIPKELPVKLMTLWSMNGNDKEARDIAPATFDYLKNVILMDAQEACKTQNLKPNALGKESRKY